MSDDGVRGYYGGADNPYEAIKVIEAWNLDFNLGNAVKYISRPGKAATAQARVEDLIKARWYLNREIAALSDGRSADVFSGCVQRAIEDSQKLTGLPNESILPRSSTEKIGAAPGTTIATNFVYPRSLHGLEAMQARSRARANHVRGTSQKTGRSRNAPIPSSARSEMKTARTSGLILATPRSSA